MPEKNIISLQEKIDTFERYFEQGNEDINGTTMFEGQPIGQWAIQIRSQLKNEHKGINPTEKQLERLDELGILERRIDSTIDEKIDALIEWQQNYPDIIIERRYKKDKPISKETVGKLRELAQAEGVEFSKIEDRYKKIQSYNEYVIYRDIKGKLTDEQKLKCKNGNLGDKFGYSTEIEKIAEKYKLKPLDVTYITRKYQTIDNFIQMYRDGKLSKDEVILYNYNLINNLINIDCNPLAENYSRLVRVCFNNIFYYEHEFLMFSSDGVEKALEILESREMEIIKLSFGLIDGVPKRTEDIGGHFGITKERVMQIKEKALRKLRKYPSKTSLFKPIAIRELKENEYVSDEERKLLTDLENDILSSNLIFKHDSIDDVDFDKDKFDVIRNILNKINIKEEEKIENLDISEMNLSVRSYMCLYRAGIKNIADLSALTEEDLMKVRNLGRKNLEEIISKLNEYGIEFPFYIEKKSEKTTEEKTDKKGYSESEIEELREKKTKLGAEDKALDEQIRKAKELLAEYNKVIGDDKVNTDDETPDFKDE